MFGQLYLDCNVMRDRRCMLSIAVVLAMVAKTLELFLTPKGRLMLTSTPCNVPAVRRFPGLQWSDLQIILLPPSWQQPARKSHVLTGLLPEDLSITSAHDRHEPHSQAAETSTAGTFSQRSPQVGRREVQEETSTFQCGDGPGAHPAALTSSQGKKERNL